jgi:hypothetical protein
MRAFASVVVVVVVCLGPVVASATPNGAPTRVQTLGSWRVHDPSAPDRGFEPWSPEDVAGFLTLHPSAFMDLGYRDGYAAGNAAWRAKGREVDQLQALLAQETPEGLGRICMTERPDMLSKRARGACEIAQGGGGCDWEGDMDGEFGEQEAIVKHAGIASAGAERTLVDDDETWTGAMWQHRLLVLRPGRAAEERRRIVRHDRTTLEVDAPWTLPPRAGERYEIRGSFDPRWVQRVPRAVHEKTVRDLWSRLRNVCGTRSAPRACNSPAEPLDPFHVANQRSWASTPDRDAIEALVTDVSVPALYGGVGNAVVPGGPPSAWSDPYFRVTSVVMDVSDPAYRAWRIRYAMYKLRDYGLAPGEPACINLTYKPGWYVHYDEESQGPSGDFCAVPGSGLWTGPAHVCRDGSAPGGPLVGGLYGPGEYEDAINAYIRELLAALAENGWEHVRIMTTERPSYTAAKWTILDPDVREHPALIGEWMGSIEPRRSELAGRPRPGGSPPPAEEPAPPPATPPGDDPPVVAEPESPEIPAEPAPPPVSPPPVVRPPTSQPSQPPASPAPPEPADPDPSPSTGGSDPPPTRPSAYPRNSGGRGSSSLPPRSSERERQRGDISAAGGGGGIVDPPSSD